MSTPNSSNQLRIGRIWRWLGIFVWLAVAAAILAHLHDRLYSTSIDVGLHGTLVSRLMESSSLPEVDENLGAMAIYPRIAHNIAAIVGVEVNSALDGMQYVSVFAVILLWSAIGFGLLRLPRRKRFLAFAGLMIALLVNRQWIGLELFGSELVATYFFAHFVAQAIAMGLLVLALQLECRKPHSLTHLLVLGIGAPFLVSVHLLPAVELLGTLCALVLLDGLIDTGKERVKRLVEGGAITLLSLALTVINPDFMTMYRLSANNGLMSLKYIDSIHGVTFLAISVALLSLGMITLWWRKQRQSASYDGLLLKYFGVFSLTISGLCIVQILLFVGFSKGSEYACFKYATGLQSMLLLDAVLLFAQLGMDRASASASAPIVFAPAALAALACTCIFPNKNFVRTEEIISAERDARLFVNSSNKPPAGTHDFAIGVAQIGGIGNFLVSQFALRTPPLGVGYDILLEKLPKDATPINRILTSRNSIPWDVQKCRLGGVGSLVAVDSACVYAEFTTLKCSDIIEFSSSGALDQASSGFSSPAPNGRWSEGPAATLTCEQANPASTVAYFDTAGLVTESHTQRMTISVNAAPSQTIEYTTQTPAHTIALPLPADNSSLLTFRFEFPDAISPAELGMSSDGRKLAVFMYRLRFENGEPVN